MQHQTSIILCRPQHPGNIGSIARAMCNFSFTNLILVSPPTDWRTHDDLLHMSNGYIEPLDNAIVVDSLADVQNRCSRLIAFTRRIGEKRPVHGELQDLKGSVFHMDQPQHFGFVFGNERTGLLSEELDYCDTLYSIATSQERGSLNLAVSAAIVMYEIALCLNKTEVYADGSSAKPITVVSHMECQKRALEIIDTLDMTDVFQRGKDQRGISQRYVHRMLSRASLTHFESNWIKKMVLILRPFVRKTPK
jgi:tRNA/rRNA methyltransferase